MRTTNHRLISLPVPLIMFPGSGQSKFMDPTFPFAKFIEGKDEVPATRILYSLGDASLRIGTSLPSKKEVKGWWDKYNGDLTMAGTLLPNEQFSTALLFAGEFLAMPPQLIWYAEDNSPVPAPSTSAAQSIKFVMVRYVSVTPGKDLDFDYSPDRTYDEISRFNRDLLAPMVTGWGAEPTIREKRFKGAIEIRIVWAIGDALLGLMNWHSPLVQLELTLLFDAPPRQVQQQICGGDSNSVR
ncbi:hypothetical protein L873DRAFT_1796616 [Choiromyces venosus 120613-1]|uniref:Uncharacterized protein n=1 Tax=Choiromyces venosus 120613-1 TaxID=1336337 RepID=A0A3N4IRY5_9PEZI|nr:hypothetical protein L873DRAFT_1796616 [Choiromyces venosus 120613-1]